MFPFIASPLGLAVFVICALLVPVIRVKARSYHDHVSFRAKFFQNISRIQYLLGIFAIMFLWVSRFLFWGLIALAVTSFGMQAVIFLTTHQGR